MNLDVESIIAVMHPVKIVVELPFAI